MLFISSTGKKSQAFIKAHSAKTMLAQPGWSPYLEIMPVGVRVATRLEQLYCINMEIGDEAMNNMEK